jgi:hypothetical protein
MDSILAPEETNATSLMRLKIDPRESRVYRLGARNSLHKWQIRRVHEYIDATLAAGFWYRISATSRNEVRRISPAHSRELLERHRTPISRDYGWKWPVAPYSLARRLSPISH